MSRQVAKTVSFVNVLFTYVTGIGLEKQLLSYWNFENDSILNTYPSKLIQVMFKTISFAIIFTNCSSNWVVLLNPSLAKLILNLPICNLSRNTNPFLWKFNKATSESDKNLILLWWLRNDGNKWYLAFKWVTTKNNS